MDNNGCLCATSGNLTLDSNLTVDWDGDYTVNIQPDTWTIGGAVQTGYIHTQEIVSIGRDCRNQSNFVFEEWETGYTYKYLLPFITKKDVKVELKHTLGDYAELRVYVEEDVLKENVFVDNFDVTLRLCKECIHYHEDDIIVKYEDNVLTIKVLKVDDLVGQTIEVQ